MIAVVNKPLAGVIGRRTAGGVRAFIDSDGADRDSYEAGTWMGMPAALSANCNRVTRNVDVGCVLGHELQIPIVVLVGLPVGRGIQSEPRVDALPLLRRSEA